jgi:hypothetical protein
VILRKWRENSVEVTQFEVMAKDGVALGQNSAFEY